MDKIVITMIALVMYSVVHLVESFMRRDDKVESEAAATRASVFLAAFFILFAIY